MRAALVKVMRAAIPVLSAVFAQPVSAGSLVDDTYLLNVTQRTRLSDLAWRLGDGGYELLDGRKVDFRRWYEPKWIDVDFHFLTQLSENLGLLWGFSTGEWGEKYRIHPSYKIGFILQHRISPQAVISVSATRRFGGGLEERPCIADYGEIGGVQSVNCRLAAAPIEPSETLQYLYRAKGLESWIGIRLRTVF